MSSSACSALTNPTAAATVTIGAFNNPGSLQQTFYVSYIYGSTPYTGASVTDQVSTGHRDAIAGDSYASLTNTSGSTVTLSPAATCNLHVNGYSMINTATSSADLSLNGTTDSASCHDANQTYSLGVTVPVSKTVYGSGASAVLTGSFDTGVYGG